MKNSHIDIIACLDGAMSEETAGKAALHLEQCRQCREMLDMFERNDAMIRSAADMTPDMFCPDMDRLIDFAAGLAAPETAAAVARHAESCRTCRQVLESLKTAAETEIGVLPDTDVPALPPSLKALLNQKRTVKSRLIDALFELASKTRDKKDLNDLMPSVEAMAALLLNNTPAGRPSYALERKLYEACPADLEPRTPPPPSALYIRMDHHVIDISSDETGTRICITQDGKPLAGVRITVGKKDDVQRTVITDDAGEAIV